MEASKPMMGSTALRLGQGERVTCLSIDDVGGASPLSID